jgi:hypothetical protein
MHRLNHLLLIICLALFTGPASTSAADDDSQEKPPPPPVRRIYDVTELVREPSVDADTSAVLPPTELNRNRPQGGGVSGNARQSSQATTPTSRIEELSTLIQSQIDPVSWHDAGGSEGSIRAYDTRLIITTSMANHTQIAQLLADLQKYAGRSVRLRAIWAALTDDELASVQESLPEKGDGNAAVSAVNLAAVDRIKNAVRYRAEISTLNAQRVNITAGRARSIISDLEPVVGNDVAAFEPTIDLVLAGASLQIRAILSADSTAVTLDLRSVISRWDPADAPPLKIPQPVASTKPAAGTTAAPPPPPPATQPAPAVEIERLNMPVQLLATATKIPTGRAVLIGGMSDDHGPQEDHRPLYLIIEATTAIPESRDK